MPYLLFIKQRCIRRGRSTGWCRSCRKRDHQDVVEVHWKHPAHSVPPLGQPAHSIPPSAHSRPSRLEQLLLEIQKASQEQVLASLVLISPEQEATLVSAGFTWGATWTGNGGAKDFGELACFSLLPSASFTLWEALGDSKLSVPSGSLTSSIGFSSLFSVYSSKRFWAANISRSPWASSSGVALLRLNMDVVALQRPRCGLIT